jgi:hypothetical protein
MGKAAQRARRLQRERQLVVFRADEPCLTYTCPACSALTITAVVDPGEPPATVRCMTTKGCTGHAVTDFSKHVPDVAAAWEWYKPDTKMIAAVRAQGGPLWEHVSRGGMMLRHRRTVRE